MQLTGLSLTHGQTYTARLYTTNGAGLTSDAVEITQGTLLVDVTAPNVSAVSVRDMDGTNTVGDVDHRYALLASEPTTVHCAWEGAPPVPDSSTDRLVRMEEAAQ